MPRYVLVRFLRAEDGTPLEVGQVVRVEAPTRPTEFGQCDIVATIRGVERRKRRVRTSCYVELREDS